MDEGTIRWATVSEKASEDDDDGYLMVGLAEQPDGAGGSLVITLAFGFDEQDRAQGMDTYCLSIAGGITQYGGVTAWGLRGHELVILLDQKTSDVFGAAGGYRLHLELDHASIQGLEEGLTRVLVGTPRDDGVCAAAPP
jgi:hypothetical protein